MRLIWIGISKYIDFSCLIGILHWRKILERCGIWLNCHISWVQLAQRISTVSEILFSKSIVLIRKSQIYSQPRIRSDYSFTRSKTHLITLYLLDSGSYEPGLWNIFGFPPSTYDYIHDVSSLYWILWILSNNKQSQTQWFLSESCKLLIPTWRTIIFIILAKIAPIERPFAPDGAKDLGHSWKRQGVVTEGGKRLAKPNALMFFHIPLQEVFFLLYGRFESGSLSFICRHITRLISTPRANHWMWGSS